MDCHVAMLLAMTVLAARPSSYWRTKFCDLPAPNRHCERSAAIKAFGPADCLDCHVAMLLAMTVLQRAQVFTGEPSFVICPRQTRHCERSVAIQAFGPADCLDCHVAMLLAMTVLATRPSSYWRTKFCDLPPPNSSLRAQRGNP